eukprot:gene5302-5355_t
MAQANAAYYTQRDPFADFTTSPEISQVFGELLGLWAAVVWQSMGAPARVILAEAGPGRGTLMADALRAIRRVVPDFGRALQVHLIETSPSLRHLQAQKLDATWHDRVEDLPDGSVILLANEFLDALPIRQFVRRDHWMERHVADGHFVERPVDIDLPDDPEGTVREICEPAEALMRHLATRFSTTHGAALFLDYGPAASAPGDSLQALQDGRPCDPLVEPGTADLTAHVDFQALARNAAPLAVHGPEPQGRFLARLGLFQRTGILARTLPPEHASRMLDGARRLAEPDGMGPSGIRRMTSDALISPHLGVRHGFFTRNGGVSKGPFASLNCSLSGADERDSVLENRARVARAIGAEPAHLLGVTQVHGIAVARVEALWVPGAGPRADAMVTAVPGLALGIVTADCAPVLFADRDRGVVAAAHAGWRGAADGILEAVVEAMQALGATTISASVGPCIRQPSYEVAADMRDAVLAQNPAFAWFFIDGERPDRWQFDLAGLCAARLEAVGVTVDVIDADTLPDTGRFFSHRRRTLADVGDRAMTASPRPELRAIFLRALPALLLLLLASCGGLPQPFAGYPGATAARLAQPPPARLTIMPPKSALLPDDAATGFADAMAAALIEQDVPAMAAAPRPGDWRLVTTAQLGDGAQSSQVIPLYTVLDGTGEQAGVQQGQPVPASAWSQAAPATLKTAADNAAPGIADLLTRIEASRRASDPNSLLNRPAKLVVPDVTGAPGDGNRQLARQMRIALAGQGMLVQDVAPKDGQTDFTVAGTVNTVPIAGGMTRIEIQWVISNPKGDERGRIVQLNEVPRGSLDRLWGDVAVVVASEAAGGVKDVVVRQSGGGVKAKDALK